MAASTTVKVASLTGAAKDDAFLSATTGLTEDSTSARLNVLANDPGAARLYSLTQSTAGLTSTAQFPVVTTAVLPSGATIRINTDGTISYDASTIQSSLQQYALGETFTDSFVYTARMANGALSTARVTVQIAGANDAPTLAAVEPVSILDSADDDTPAAVTGMLGGADVDHGAVLSYRFAEGVAYSVAADGTLVSTSAYGTISLNAQTGAYSFVADADAIDALAAGVNASAAFGVQVTDEHGATALPATLSFNLIGANDTAEISGEASGSVADKGTAFAAGTLTVSDRDAGEAAFGGHGSLAGVYGDFTFDIATGAWTYALRDSAAVTALSASDTVTDALVVTSLDGSATETIVVSISGADEPAGNSKPENPVTRHLLNHGLTVVNNRVIIDDFDANDVLAYVRNFAFNGMDSADVNGDGVIDTILSFDYTRGKTTEPVEVVLLGVASLSGDQLMPVSGGTTVPTTPI
ncbi:MAG TPA: VCBS domain-containing protein [Noviherbaspirillum sp.]